MAHIAGSGSGNNAAAGNAAAGHVSDANGATQGESVAAAAPVILPGATLGVLGGGQLGRYFVIAARQMGYRVIVLDPDADSPAGAIADVHIHAPYEDPAALARMAKDCAAVTTEFESVPAASLALLATHCIVAPSADCVAIAQDRVREKRFLQSNGFAVAPFVVIEEEGDLAAEAVFPAILKRATLGYDGKGQQPVGGRDQLREAWLRLGRARCVLEARLPLEREVSVILARTRAGEVRSFPVAENRHRDGILDTTVVPARITPELTDEARAVAARIAACMGYVGVLAVEFFVSDGRLIVNELAPRPHNSGHYTLDASTTSQFEQQVRALCGLPLGAADLLAPAAMVNILGDAMLPAAPRWADLLARPGVKLHLYGKREPRAGRKMGHLTVLGAQAAEEVQGLRAGLGIV